MAGGHVHNRLSSFLSRWLSPAGVALFLLLVLGLQPLWGAQLKSVQSGSTTIGASSTSATATITAVDTSKAFLVFGVSLDENKPASGEIAGQITNSTTLTFERDSTGGAVTVYWHVAEFQSGVSVQRGQVTLDGTSANIAISSVDTAKAFPLISWKKDEPDFDDEDFVRAKITTSTNLRLTVVNGDGQLVVQWQVVEYTDASVQTGELSFASSDGSKTAAVTSVDTSKAWLIYSYESAAGTTANIGQKMVRGVITNSTTLTFDRDNTGQTMTLTWYLVEFTDGTTVQHNSLNFASGDSQKNVTLNSVETGWSIALGGAEMRGGKTPFSTDDNPGVAWFTFELTSATNLRVTRGKTGATADVGWFVIQFVANTTWAPVAEGKVESTGWGNRLSWRTSSEWNHLGFHVWRQDGGARRRLTRELVPGSLALVGAGVGLSAGQSYAWLDPAGRPGDRYWLQALDLSGQSSWAGPFQASGRGDVKTRWPRLERMVWQGLPADSPASLPRITLGQEREAESYRPQRRASYEEPTVEQLQRHREIASGRALKIEVGEEGLYRILQPELVRLGLPSGIDPRRLQLLVEGREVAMSVVGQEDGRFDVWDWIEFYAFGADTPWQETRVYWLVEGLEPGKRWARRMSRPGAEPPLPLTGVVERRDRNVYLAAVRNGEEDNFFGPLVREEPVELVLHIPDLEEFAPEASLKVILQGLSPGSHRVEVKLNGAVVGELRSGGRELLEENFPLPPGLLTQGANRVQLRALEGVTDVTAVDRIQIRYPRRQGPRGRLLLEGEAEGNYLVRGFPSPEIRVLDVTQAGDPVEWAGVVLRGDLGFEILFHAEAGHRYLVVDATQALRPLRMELYEPPHWEGEGEAEVLVVAPAEWLSAMVPWVEYRRDQGWKVLVATDQEIYDRYGFGHKSPHALRRFTREAWQQWSTRPRYLLLVGDASLDPRGFLKRDVKDWIPTKILGTAFLETASDDWFADFDEDGVPEMAVGRLPAQNEQELATMIEKILAFEVSQEEWKREVVLIAEEDEEVDFVGMTQGFLRQLPPGFGASFLSLGEDSSREVLKQWWARGFGLVGYFGHGSVEVWSGRGFLRSGEVAALGQEGATPVVFSLTCLNGFFHDVFTESLAEALLRVQDGGAVAVWASSGLTDPAAQERLGRVFLKSLLEEPGISLGEAVRKAKSAVQSNSVRGSWILLGDPLMPLF